MVKYHGGVRRITHDPATGMAFPCHASYVKPVKGKRNTPRYKLKVPDALCEEWGIKSRAIVYRTLKELMDSDLYKRVVEGELRLNQLGAKRIKRTAVCRDDAVREYEQMMRDGVQIPPQIRFREGSAVWAVTRTFGTGWAFRATALTYKDALRLHDECVNVRSVAEVVGDSQPTPAPSKGPRLPFSRKMLSQSADQQEKERGEAEGFDGEAEEIEDVEVEAEEVEEGLGNDDDDDVEAEMEEEVELEVEDVTFRSSRSGRAYKRTNRYIKEPAQPQHLAKRSKAVVGTPVMAVAIKDVGASSSGASTSAPIPRYDDTEEMRSLKEIRKRIAHLL